LRDELHDAAARADAARVGWGDEGTPTTHEQTGTDDEYDINSTPLGSLRLSLDENIPENANYQHVLRDHCADAFHGYATA
jgi:hypothetical protein